MANITTTFTSLLATVETTANSATKIVFAAGRGIDMLDRYAAEHQHKQALRIAIDRSTYKTTLLNENAMRIAKEEDKIQTELNNNQQLKKIFTENYDMLKEALAQAELSLK